MPLDFANELVFDVIISSRCYVGFSAATDVNGPT